jgi:hypothetical protein
VLASLGSVLFSQPRAGVWIIVREWSAGVVPPRTWINLSAALFATGLIAWFVVHRVRHGVRWPLTHGDQLVAVAAAVVAANAFICYPYTKDEVLTTAGAFYAIAAYVAIRGFLDVEAGPFARRTPLPWAATAALVAVCVVGSTAWATRALGIHYILTSQAFYQRNDWAFLPFEWAQNGLDPQTAAGRALADQLRDQAISMRVPAPHVLSYWPERIFDGNY